MRRLRRDLHLSQNDLAVQVGLDRTYISLLELGRRSPTLDTIVSLAAALKMSLSGLFSELEIEIARDTD
nr:helix-turn-helix transcriptional regulator [Burkholderia sp. Tr-20390]